MMRAIDDPVAAARTLRDGQGGRTIHSCFLMFALFVVACSPRAREAGYTVNSPESVAKRQSSANDPQERVTEDQASSKNLGRASDVPSAAQRSGEARSSTGRLKLAQLPKGGSVVGKAGPIALEAWGAKGQWVAYCQPAQAGEGWKPAADGAIERLNSPTKLVLQIGATERPIDAVLRTDETGRYLVTLEEGRAWLVDALQTRSWDLSSLDPDLRFDALSDHRAFVFAGGGLVLLSKAKKARAQFIPLGSAPADQVSADSLLEQAVAIQLGGREIWRVSGGLGHAEFVSAGALDDSKSWPVPALEKPRLRCGSQPERYSAYSRLSAFRPDRKLETLWVPIVEKSKAGKQTARTLKAEVAPGYVMGFDDGWVRREDTGRLLWVSRGTQKQIASSRCGARILHVDRKRGLFLIACEEYRPVVEKKRRKKSKSRRPPRKYRFDLYLVRPGYVRDLNADVARTGVDVVGNEQNDLLPLRPGAFAALVDFKGRQLHTLEGSLQILSTSNEKALIRRGRHFVVWSNDGEQKLKMQLPLLDPILSAGSAVSVGDVIFVLEKELRTWSLPASPLALSPLGYALVPTQASDQEHWAEGPLLLIAPPE